MAASALRISEQLGSSVALTFLPFDVEDLLDHRLLETQDLQVFLIHGLWLASIDQDGEDNGEKSHEICSWGEFMVVEYMLVDCSKSPMNGFDVVVNTHD